MEDRVELIELTDDMDLEFLGLDCDGDCEACDCHQEKEEQQAFIIDDDKKASWALKKYKLLEIEEERKKNLVKDEIDRLKFWLDQEQEKIEKKKALLSQSLSGYLYQLRKDNPKAKIDTPFGAVTTRKTPAKWTYDDETVIKFLHQAEMNEFIRVKEEVEKTPLKKALKVVDGKAYTEAGEEVEGITVTDQGEVLSIKTI